jgi:uncharacterized protein YdeI (YjbR/CyaY-like superfamily)
MMDLPQSSLEFKHRDQWRAWLAEHHQAQSAAWIVIYKKNFRDQGLSLEEAVEEALCYGWIDGTLRRLDEKRYILRFSPRTSTSVWSMSNIRRVDKLIRDGRMTEAGLEKVAAARESGEWAAAIRREQVDLIPKDLESALRKKQGAIAAYRALSDSRKKQIIFWLQSAKRAETRKKRVQSIVEELTGD